MWLNLSLLILDFRIKYLVLKNNRREHNRDINMYVQNVVIKRLYTFVDILCHEFNFIKIISTYRVSQLKYIVVKKGSPNTDTLDTDV